MSGPTIHGYRSEHGCETSILELIERAVEAQEDESQFGVCLYDQSAAFDLLDFYILEIKIRELRLGKERIRCCTDLHNLWDSGRISPRELYEKRFFYLTLKMCKWLPVSIQFKDKF